MKSRLCMGPADAKRSSPKADNIRLPFVLFADAVLFEARCLES